MLIPNTDETLNDNLYVLFAHANVEKLTKLQPEPSYSRHKDSRTIGNVS